MLLTSHGSFRFSAVGSAIYCATRRNTVRQGLLMTVSGVLFARRLLAESWTASSSIPFLSEPSNDDCSTNSLFDTSHHIAGQTVGKHSALMASRLTALLDAPTSSEGY